MSVSTLIFLAGLFLPPVILLAAGHAYRHRSATVRAAFWGGVAGYALGGAVTAVAVHFPTMAWADAATARDMAVHGSLLVGPLLGALIGAGIAWTRGRVR